LKKDIRKHSQGVVGGTYKPTNRLMMHSEVVAEDDTKRFSTAVKGKKNEASSPNPLG